MPDQPGPVPAAFKCIETTGLDELFDIGDGKVRQSQDEIIQSGKKTVAGAFRQNRVGALIWNELQTRDLEAATAFYTDVFGWEPRVDAQGYVACYQEGRVHAGMMAMDDEWDENIPPNWAVYFMVDDIGETADRAKKLGGTVVVPPTTAGELGKFAVIQDPQGGVFTAMEFQGPADPPPGY